MAKTKQKNSSNKKRNSKVKDLKKYALKRIDDLSWQMGKKNYLSRAELYDR
ncbi:MAG: hypothetical protein R6W68_04735 [Ignavibacteriaceae bacterium]